LRPGGERGPADRARVTVKFLPLKVFPYDIIFSFLYVNDGYIAALVNNRQLAVVLLV
jgi:hypothetical protein